MCGPLICKKNPYLEGSLFVQGCELPSTPVQYCKSTAPFFRPLAPPHPPLPLIPPPGFPHTCDTIFQTSRRLHGLIQKAIPIIDTKGSTYCLEKRF